MRLPWSRILLGWYKPGLTTSCGHKTSLHIPLQQNTFLPFAKLTCKLVISEALYGPHQVIYVVEPVHPPSIPSLPAASLQTGSLLPQVGRPTLLIFFLLTRMDIDAVSLAAAQSNIERNGLSERITLLRADPAGSILLPLVQGMVTSCVIHGVKSGSRTYRGRRFDFSICNPPFYASAEEASQSAGAKEF